MEMSSRNAECSSWDDPEDYQCEIAYRASNLESLSAPKQVFKIGDAPGVEINGNIEKVPKTIRNRSARDPFVFAKKKPVLSIEIRDATF